MKVLLLAPYAGGESVDREGKIFKERVFPAPALGVHHIASHLRRQGHLCDVLDPNIQRPLLDSNLKANRYDIVGISTNHQTLEHDLGLAHLVKQLSPNSLLLAGGIEATFNPHQIFDHSPIDAIVLGEGESPMSEICRRTVLEQIPGLYLRGLRHPAGVSTGWKPVPLGKDLLFTGHRPAMNREEFARTVLELDFKEIPYPIYWSSLEARYNGQITPRQLQEIRTLRLYTTNYCPYECAFCSATHFRSFVEGRKSPVVSLDAGEMLEVLRRALIHHPQTETIFFADDDFILNAQRCVEVCRRIVEAKGEGKLPPSLSFIANTRLNNLTPDLLSAMEAAGWRIILCGVESFSPRLLVEYEKKYKIEAVHTTLEYLLRTQIHPYLTIILFSPECTMDDVVVNVQECIRYALRGAGLGIYPYVMPLPGCRMIEREGMEIERLRVPIPGTDRSIEKVRRLLPRDPVVRELLYQMDRSLEERQEELGRRYHIAHFSSRLYSLLFLHVICEALDLKDQLKDVEYLLTKA